MQLPTRGIKQLDLMSCSQLIIGYHFSFLQFCEEGNITYGFVHFMSNEWQWHNQFTEIAAECCVRML